MISGILFYFSIGLQFEYVTKIASYWCLSVNYYKTSLSYYHLYVCYRKNQDKSLHPPQPIFQPGPKQE